MKLWLIQTVYNRKNAERMFEIIMKSKFQENLIQMLQKFEQIITQSPLTESLKIEIKERFRKQIERAFEIQFLKTNSYEWLTLWIENFEKNLEIRLLIILKNIEERTLIKIQSNSNDNPHEDFNKKFIFLFQKTMRKKIKLTNGKTANQYS